ncbi:MAG: 3-dehydroquinate synthase [Elusimicrobia bacterium]|nr:3-dehydroquinate synthase [Elusimicrobiota bacterium]
MAKIIVRLKENSYPIIVGSGVLSDAGRLIRQMKVAEDAVIVTNPLVRRLHGRVLLASLKRAGFSAKVFEVKDSESSKSVKVAMALIEKVIRYTRDKRPVVIAFGGGVVGDLTGFVAASAKRGLPLVQIPTTFLAQVDSSIGGKVAVDLPSGKNLVGAFYQPRLVLADTALLRTLSTRQIRNGLAEVVKYGVLKDAALFSFVEKNASRLLKADPKVLSFVVERCAAIKAGVVSKDEKETKGLRTVLNFGHTVGHAIESASGFKYQHGEAVALGMRAACAISVALKLMRSSDADRVGMLLSLLGLPEQVKGVSARKVLSAMTFDKKFSGKKNRFVLARGIGNVVVRAGVPSRVIEDAVGDLF